MTLLIAVGCPDFVVQVSDRRLTVSRNDRTWVANDEANKELLIRSPVLTVAVTFTGYGVFLDQPLGDWLLEVVSHDRAEEGFESVLQAIAEGADRMAVRLRTITGRLAPHAFL